MQLTGQPPGPPPGAHGTAPSQQFRAAEALRALTQDPKTTFCGQEHGHFRKTFWEVGRALHSVLLAGQQPAARDLRNRRVSLALRGHPGGGGTGVGVLCVGGSRGRIWKWRDGNQRPAAVGHRALHLLPFDSPHWGHVDGAAPSFPSGIVCGGLQLGAPQKITGSGCCSLML